MGLRCGTCKTPMDNAEQAREHLQKCKSSDLPAGYEAKPPQRQRKDRPWSEYPIGTKAHSISGGHWTKTNRGWKRCSGSTFPTPGGDAVDVTLPAS